VFVWFSLSFVVFPSKITHHHHISSSLPITLLGIPTTFSSFVFNKAECSIYQRRCPPLSLLPTLLADIDGDVLLQDYVMGTLLVPEAAWREAATPTLAGHPRGPPWR